MIEFTSRSPRRCDGLSRRSFSPGRHARVRASLSLADVLRANASASAAGRASTPERSVILIWLDGGPPQHETYDPKPDAPAEFRGPLKPISTALAGRSGFRAPAQPRPAARQDVDHPLDASRQRRPLRRGPLDVDRLSRVQRDQPGPAVSVGRVDRRQAQGAEDSRECRRMSVCRTRIRSGLVPGYHGGGVSGRRLTTRSSPTAIPTPTATTCPTCRCRPASTRVGSRAAAPCSAHSTTLAGGVDAARAWWRASTASSRRRSRWSSATRLARAFDLNKEDPRLRDRYSRHQWGQSALLARRLVEAGVRFVTLTFGGWDYPLQPRAGDEAMSCRSSMRRSARLIEDLDDRGLLDSTIVMVMGEFGRTPRMNKKGVPGSDPVPGRDHWGNVMSVLVAGGGLARGRVVGSSNSRGEVPKDRPLRPARPARHSLSPARHRPRDHLLSTAPASRSRSAPMEK